MTTKTLNRTLIASALLAALGPVAAHAEDGKPSALKAVVTPDGIRAGGGAELAKLLQSMDASFGLAASFLSGGTDIIRPATLEGMGPDQLLVLVNGKRRHQNALVNVQQTVGRGSTGTDFDAIPLSAIDHIELLRGEAAARYGSDATAGVINIVLRKGTGTQVAASAGTTGEGDGDSATLSVNHGMALGGAGGFLNLSLEGRKRGATNRADVDTLINPPRVTQRIGDIATRDISLWANSVLPTGHEGELYAFGGASRRSGDDYALFRAAGDPRNVPALYPQGYVPQLAMTVRDAALAVGYRTALGSEWKFDASVNYGRNEIRFGDKGSVNVSYWYEPKCSCSIYGESPTEADAGKLAFTQATANLDFSGPVTLLGSRIDISTGLEYRRDAYRIDAGEPVSYQFGRTDNRAIKILDQNGGPAAPGMQGFQGFSPADAVDDSRHNVAFYLDMQQKLGKNFSMGSAARYERYSEIGRVTAGNVVLRYDPSPAFGLVASSSTGFRAPSVHQRFYGSTITDLGPDGTMTRTITAREGSAAATAIGTLPLHPELTRTISAGLTLRPADDFTLAANAYRTVLLDRIVLTSPITKNDGYCPVPGTCLIAGILDALHTDQVQLFANAINTVTRGVDVTAQHTLRGHGATLVLTGQLGFNHTQVTGRYSTSPYVSAAQLFDDSQVTLVERGQPRQHHVVKADFSSGPWSVNARANYYGAVEGQGYTAPYVQAWDAKWLLDLSARYMFGRQLSLQVGANNVFDTYPASWNRQNAAPYPQMGFGYCWETCPFGINGRTLFARMEYAF